MKRYSKSELAKAYLALARSPREAVRALAAALIMQKMTHEIDFVVREVSRQLQSQGVVVAGVTSARQLSAELKSTMETFLKRLTGAKQLHTDYHLDQNLIGGFIAQLPTQEIDASLASLLRRLSPVSSSS